LLLEPDSRYGAQLISTLHHLNKKVYRKDCAVVLSSVKSS
jgi:ACT domain-containing protein